MSPMSPKEDSSPEGDFSFLGTVTSKTTLVTKITHLFFQRTLLPAAVSCPWKQWKLFSSLG